MSHWQISNFFIWCPYSSNENYFPHPKDCQRFIRCMYGWPYEFRCPRNYEWNQLRSSCVYSSKINTRCWPFYGYSSVIKAKSRYHSAAIYLIEQRSSETSAATFSFPSPAAQYFSLNSRQQPAIYYTTAKEFDFNRFANILRPYYHQSLPILIVISRPYERRRLTNCYHQLNYKRRTVKKNLSDSKNLFEEFLNDPSIDFKNKARQIQNLLDITTSETEITAPR